MIRNTFAFLLGSLLATQAADLGPFAADQDVGQVSRPGSVEFDSAIKPSAETISGNLLF